MINKIFYDKMILRSVYSDTLRQIWIYFTKEDSFIHSFIQKATQCHMDIYRLEV